ncbi:MAG: response regulator, partial [Deltaproteobacteria bacterium]|nr:response regulator [Deltaproteobacteria bacterium]
MEKTKILIVEDETITAMEIESQLQGLGYEITSIVDTGEKAIQKAEEDKPDLILMDIRIKGEMDGIDTAEEIRNKFGIPVIFSTAYLDEERIERAKITMPFGYVLKPIQERDLKVTIEMALYVTKVDTERKKAEQKIQNSEKEYRALANNIPAMIYRGNPDWSSKMVSNSILLSGYSSDEFNSGKVRWLDIIHPDDKESVYQKGV